MSKLNYLKRMKALKEARIESIPLVNGSGIIYNDNELPIRLEDWQCVALGDSNAKEKYNIAEPQIEGMSR